MPAYYSVMFELKKSPTAIEDFLDAFVRSGPVFKSGYGYESDSREDILKWNQNKLNEDFELGYEEDCSHDYKQMLFDFSDFSHVRLFINNRQNEPTFYMYLLVPEDDLLEYVEKSKSNPIKPRQFEVDRIRYSAENDAYSELQRQDRMDLLKQLAKNVWQNAPVLAIQTGWEDHDEPVKYRDISAKCSPLTQPFSIVSNDKYHSEWDFKAYHIGRDGTFLEAGKWYDCTYERLSFIYPVEQSKQNLFSRIIARIWKRH